MSKGVLVLLVVPCSFACSFLVAGQFPVSLPEHSLRYSLTFRNLRGVPSA